MQDLLDLDQYPLDRPGTPDWQALVDRCRADLARDGMFNLEGLVREAAIQQIAAPLAPRFHAEAFRHEREHNIYFRDDLPLPADHPALANVLTSNDTLCGDQITESPVWALYHWAPLAEFLAATMAKPALHVMADPLAGVNVMSYGAGQALNWHFDRSEFTTTLLLQAPEEGGVFEYRTDLRTAEDPNYDGVARLLRGQDDLARKMAVSAGTLNVFRGVNTAHRVTPIVGPRPRIIAVLTYFETPGRSFSDTDRIGFYGRSGPVQT